MILLSSPNISGNEWKYVKECLDTEWVSSVGSYVTDFENYISEYTGSKYSVACSSGTSALHISLLVSDIKRDDYVILPNITFIASANSIKYVGANPIFIDVDLNNWQMDIVLLNEFLEKKTYQKNNKCLLKKDNKYIKAIMPVHVLGNILDIDKLLEIGNNHNIQIIEDSSESLGSFYKSKHSGTFGKIGVFSFNGNKIITTGGGGMIITDDDEIAKEAKHLTTQAKSDPFEYFHNKVGYNYRLVNVLAAMGVAQLEQLDKFIIHKKRVEKIYKEELKNVGDIEFQTVSEDVNSNSWLFTIKTKFQKKLLSKLNENKVQSRPLWIPMNRLPMYNRDIFYTNNDNSLLLYNSCLSIPSSSNLKDSQLDFIIKLIKSEFL